MWLSYEAWHNSIDSSFVCVETLFWPSRHCSHPWRCMHSGGIQMETSRILAPERWGAYQRKDFSEPRLLHLPIQRKTLKSLTWDVWFSFINSHLLRCLLPGLCDKKTSMYPGYSFISSEQCQAWSPQNVCPIKEVSGLPAGPEVKNPLCSARDLLSFYPWSGS